MRANITSDGRISIIPETELEDFTLRQWSNNFGKCIEHKNNAECFAILETVAFKEKNEDEL